MTHEDRIRQRLYAFPVGFILALSIYNLVTQQWGWFLFDLGILGYLVHSYKYGHRSTARLRRHGRKE